jgi:hypothetical protein
VSEQLLRGDGRASGHAEHRPEVQRLELSFWDTAKERKLINPETGRVEAEFDILLENGEYSVSGWR